MDVFSDSLGSLRNSVSGQLSGEDEFDSRLNFPRGESSSLVESDEFGSLSGDSVESVMNERVQDIHGLLGDADVGVDLLEHLVDVDAEALLPGALALLLATGDGGLGSLGGLLGGCGLGHLNNLRD